MLAPGANIRKRIFNANNDLRKKQDVLQCQRSRINFLNFGDFNSSLFNYKANERKSTNHIAELKDVDGQVYKDIDNLERIIVAYSLAPVNVTYEFLSLIHI